MADYGVSSAGFTPKPLDVVMETFREKWRGIFGDDVDLSADTPDTQILAALAFPIEELWQALAGVHAGFRPTTAFGSALFELGAFNGIARDEGTRSQVSIYMTTGIGGPQFSVPTSVRIASPLGDVFRPRFQALNVNDLLVMFEAVETGPISVPAGVSWTVLTPIVGNPSLSNSGPAAPIGTRAETEGEFRVRRAQSTEISATNIVESLYAAVLNVNGVTDARIYENRTAGTVNSRPPYSYEVVVLGGTDADIAAAIWGNHTAGIPIYGTSPENIIDSQGQTQVISFTRPTPVPIIVDAVLIADTGYPASGDDDIAAAIVAQEFGIGRNVSRSRLFDQFNSVPGHTVDTLEIGRPTLAATDITISEREIPEFTLGNITISS